MFDKYRNRLIFLSLWALCIANLVYMHFSVSRGTTGRFLDNGIIFANCLLDTSLLGLLAFLCSLGRVRVFLWMTFVLTLLLSLSNVIYSRFFGNYLTFDCLTVVGEFGLSFYWQYATEAFRWSDIFYVISIVLFVYFVRRLNSVMWYKQSIVILGTILGFYILRDTAVWTKDLQGSKVLLSGYSRGLSLSQRPTISQQSGLILCQAYMLYTNQTEVELTEEEKDYIQTHYNQTVIETDSIPEAPSKNIVIILVESYLSCVTDSVYEGREVTPFLNELKKQPYVYYNGQMKSNISIGESSDGQFIYMTGLYPLEDVSTVSIAKSKRFLSPPELLKRNYGYRTMITLPTTPDCWQQQQMCVAYGIDSIYCSYDVSPEKTHLNDSEVFQLAREHQNPEETPFFDMVLTYSMHSPYTDVPFEPIVEKGPYSQEFRNYMAVCRYTDRQLQAYFDWTKRVDLFENTIFIIVADHHAHDYFLKMTPEELGNLHVPFFLVDTDRDFSDCPKYECNQTDVYTTLTEYLHLQSPWRGVGQNLLSSDSFADSDILKNKEMSARIIRSNYFKQYFTAQE